MRRREFFRIRQFRRVYDRAEGKFTFNISYETHTKPTPRSLVVAEALLQLLERQTQLVALLKRAFTSLSKQTVNLSPRVNSLPNFKTEKGKDGFECRK